MSAQYALRLICDCVRRSPRRLRVPRVACPPVKPEGDKILRMNAHLAPIEAGYVHLPRRAHWLEEFRKEVIAFPATRFDNQIDALSQALDRAFNYRGGEVRTGTLIGLY